MGGGWGLGVFFFFFFFFFFFLGKEVGGRKSQDMGLVIFRKKKKVERVLGGRLSLSLALSLSFSA